MTRKMNTHRGEKLGNIKRCATKSKNGERKQEKSRCLLTNKTDEKPRKYPLVAQQKTGEKLLKNRLALYPKTDEKTPEISLTSTPGKHPTERRPTTSPRKPPHAHAVPQNPSERTPQHPHTGRKQKNRPPHTPTKTATTSPQNGDKPSTTKQRHPPLWQQYASPQTEGCTHRRTTTAERATLHKRQNILIHREVIPSCLDGAQRASQTAKREGDTRQSCSFVR